MKRWAFLSSIFLLAAVLLSACGGSNDNGNKNASTSASASASASSASKDAAATPPASGQAASGAAKEIAINAKNFEFDQTEIRVAQGDEVTIKLVNAAGNHSLKIDGYDQEVKGGQSVTFTADKAGEFKFYCNIMCGSGHANMSGKLIVE